MEGIWYLLLILALYLLPELLKKLRKQQTPRYEYPPPPSPPAQMEAKIKEEDTAETAKIEKECMPERRALREAPSSSGQLNSRTVLQGIIWAEILKPPLSKRREETGRLRRS